MLTLRNVQRIDMTASPAQNVPSQQLDPTNYLTVNSRLLSGDKTSTASKCAAVNMCNRQLTTLGRSQLSDEDNDGPSC